ncbi:MAG: energy transducer TonB, partial [Burkholderiales bacterium]
SVSYTVFDPALFDPPATTERPLGVSVLASTLLHALVIVALASIAPKISLLPAWRGVSAPIQVELRQPVVPVPEPAPEPVTAIAVPELSPAPAPVPPQEAPAQPPVQISAAASSLPAQQLSLRAGPASPTGSITVGLLHDPAKLSTATAARLEQRFPVVAARTPKLGGAVIARYPPDAARARRSAHVAAVLTLDASGKIVDKDTILVPDDPMFHDAVLAAVASAKFTPAELEGKQIPYWVILNFFFDIDPLPGAHASAER